MAKRNILLKINKMKKKNVIEFTDIVEHAVKLGYKWNDACDFLDYFYPSYGMRDCSIKELAREGNKDCKKVMESFYKKHKVTEFSISPKSC